MKLSQQTEHINCWFSITILEISWKISLYYLRSQWFAESFVKLSDLLFLRNAIFIKLFELHLGSSQIIFSLLQLFSIVISLHIFFPVHVGKVIIEIISVLNSCFKLFEQDYIKFVKIVAKHISDTWRKHDGFLEKDIAIFFQEIELIFFSFKSISLILILLFLSPDNSTDWHDIISLLFYLLYYFRWLYLFSLIFFAI